MSEADIINLLRQAEHGAAQPTTQEARLPELSPEGRKALLEAREMIEHLKTRLDELSLSRHRYVERARMLELQFDDLAEKYSELREKL